MKGQKIEHVEGLMTGGTGELIFGTQFAQWLFVSIFDVFSTIFT